MSLRFHLLCLSLLMLTLFGCSRQSNAPVVGPPKPPPLFVDVATQAGLNYRWRISGSRPLNILQTIGNGCAFLDYDNDGNLDVLLVGPRLALYKGDGHGGFTDATRQMGLDKLSGHFLGCAVGDYDNDGYDDVYVTAYRGGVLLHNEAGKRYRDVTRTAGIKAQPWGTSVGWAETTPGSGRLDLFVCNYAAFDPAVSPKLCKDRGILSSCGPRYYRPIHGVLYRNDGNGHFTDVTSARSAISTGRDLGVAFGDFDGSGTQSIALANDEISGDLLHPTGHEANARYTNIARSAGTATDRDGSIHGGMGVDWGDYDNDGKLDLLVTTFQNEPKSLYHNEGNGLFADCSIPTAIAAFTTPYVAFGCKFFDYDNDGWLDAIIANGHVQDNIQQIDAGTTYRQAPQLLHNQGSTPLLFQDVSRTAGPDFMRPLVGRGLAVGDYDNDGRLDILIVDSESSPLLLHNQATPTGHWLGVRLIGAKSNRDGFGALLTLTVNGHPYLRQCQSGGSYMSASDRRVHFGLASATHADKLTIRWPSGRIDTYRDIAADRYITVTEGGQSIE